MKNKSKKLPKSMKTAIGNMNPPVNKDEPIQSALVQFLTTSSSNSNIINFFMTIIVAVSFLYIL